MVENLDPEVVAELKELGLHEETANTFKGDDLSWYCNNTPNGSYHGVLMNVLWNVNYGAGRRRDLIVFAICTPEAKPILDSQQLPMTALICCNPTKGKSSKSKINRLRRFLIQERHQIDLMKSVLILPTIKDFLWREGTEPYKIKVVRKKTNNKTVSIVTHIYSYLLKKYVETGMKFDGPDTTQ